MDKKSVRAVWLVVVASHTSVLIQSSLLSVPLSLHYHTQCLPGLQTHSSGPQLSTWHTEVRYVYTWCGRNSLMRWCILMNRTLRSLIFCSRCNTHTHYMCQHAHQQRLTAGDAGLWISTSRSSRKQMRME